MLPTFKRPSGSFCSGEKQQASVSTGSRCQANAQSVELQTAQEPEFERLRDLAVGDCPATPRKTDSYMELTEGFISPSIHNLNSGM